MNNSEKDDVINAQQLKKKILSKPVKVRIFFWFFLLCLIQLKHFFLLPVLFFFFHKLHVSFQDLILSLHSLWLFKGARHKQLNQLLSSEDIHDTCKETSIFYAIQFFSSFVYGKLKCVCFLQLKEVFLVQRHFS